MTKGVVNDAILELIGVLDRSLDVHRFKIRQNASLRTCRINGR